MTYTTNAERKQFTTKDGAEISYLDIGEGQPMVLIHGWSQSALQWYNQIDEFSSTHRVVAIDLRGHGESSKVGYGYRLYRLAQDVKELMNALKLESTILMGHSMGCSIMWTLWDLYGDDGIDKMIFCDNSPYPLDNPTRDEASKIHAAEGITPESSAQLALGWANDTDGSFARGFLRQQFSPDAADEIFEAAYEHHMMLPKQHRAKLMFDIIHHDLCDVIPRITVPSLFVGGRISLINWKSVVWQGENAPQGSHVIFEEDEAGAHFMFLENHTKYNQIVSDFLKQ